MRAVAALATPAGRRRQGRFLVEGPHAVTDLLLASLDVGPRVVAVYADPDALVAHPAVMRAAVRAGRPVRPATAEVMRAMSDAATPQGVVAVAELPAPTDRVPASPAGFVPVLVEARDPGNVGTVIRAADAAGAAGVVLTPGCADAYSPKVVRSAAGSLFHTPTVTDLPLAAVVEQARGMGARVVATAVDGCLTLEQAVSDGRAGRGPLAGTHLWLLGNEAHGLDPEQRDLADAVVRIPLRGRAESLNLAMAATLVLFGSARVREDATADPGGSVQRVRTAREA